MSEENKSKGIILMYKISEKIALMLGVTLLLFNVLLVIAFSTDGEKDGPIMAAVLTLFFYIGFKLLSLAKEQHRLIKNFKIFETILSVDPAESIDNIATSLGTSPEVIKYNIEQMIKIKFFVNTYLDYNMNRVIFNPMTQQMQKQEKQVKDVKLEESDDGYTIITCKSCGAINKIAKGTVIQCEYCGTYMGEE